MGYKKTEMTKFAMMLLKNAQVTEEMPSILNILFGFAKDEIDQYFDPANSAHGDRKFKDILTFRDIVDEFYMLDPSYFVNNEKFHDIFSDGINASFFVTLDQNSHLNIKFVLQVQSSNGGQVYDLFAGFNFPPDYFESIPTGNDDWIDRDDYGFEAYTQPILGGEEDVSGTHLWTMLKF